MKYLRVYVGKDARCEDGLLCTKYVDVARKFAKKFPCFIIDEWEGERLCGVFDGKFVQAIERFMGKK